jgi:hypothetical protein
VDPVPVDVPYIIMLLAQQLVIRLLAQQLVMINPLAKV